LYNSGAKWFGLQDYLLAFLVTVLFASPWQIYTWIKFPEEKAVEFSNYLVHFTEAVEGHRGNFWYHFQHIDLLYGTIVPFILIPAMYILYRTAINRKLAVAFLSYPVFIYLFFSIAKTKMPSFPFMVFLPVMISLAAAIHFIFKNLTSFISGRFPIKIVPFVGMLLIIWFNIKLKSIHENHSHQNIFASSLIHNKEIFIKLKETLPNNSVIFNVKRRHFIESMFYTGHTSYDFIASKKQILALRNKNYQIAIFNYGKLPDYILNDDQIITIQYRLIGVD